MGGFGDQYNSMMRGVTLPMGGLRIEAGCWTQGADVTAHIPTQLTTIVAFLCGSGASYQIPEISGSFIKCGLASTATSKILNYIAIGW